MVYQRTAAYSTPAFNRPLTNSEIDTMKGNYDQYRQEQRLSPAGIINPERQLERVMDVPKEERQRRFEEAWDEGLLTGLMSTFSDIQLDEDANHEVAEFIRDRIRNTVQDRQTADDLTRKPILMQPNGLASIPIITRPIIAKMSHWSICGARRLKPLPRPALKQVMARANLTPLSMPPALMP